MFAATALTPTLNFLITLFYRELKQLTTILCFFFPELGYGPYEFNSTKIRQHFTK